MNLRDNVGLVLNTGFQQLNGRLNLTQKAMNDKLSVSLDYAVTNRDESAIPSEAMAYAAVYNPTSPVYDPNATQYGGYYEEIKFDYYNPLSIAEQTNIDNNFKKNLMSIKGTYQLA